MVLAQKHYLYNLGESPFNFEKYWFEARDEVDAQWLMKLGDHKVEIKTAHYLPTLEPKDIDYVFALGFHCYDIILTYRAMRHEVTFGADLVSR
jgi:hypothetical protein